MKKKDKPSKLFEQIAAVDDQYSRMTKIFDEEDKIAIVLGKAPKKYASMLANMESKYGNKLKMKSMEEAMKKQFQ
eukprot:6293523-Ditylum_brightwellii.AAC.1